MAKVKPLSDRQIKAAAAKDKEYKLADGDGLYLHVKPNGSKLWRLRYVLDGKSSTKSLGKYPDVNLTDARKKRVEIRKEVAQGIKPVKKVVRQSGMIFSELCEAYFAHRSDLSQNYIDDNTAFLKNHYYPTMEYLQLDDIEVVHIIEVVKMLQRKGTVTVVKKTGSLLNRIFKYGVTMQHMKRNVMADIDLSVLVKPHKPKNFAHITDEEEFKGVLKSIDLYPGDLFTRTALQLMPYVFLRPANIRGALWSEFDFDKKLWTIPAEKMKTGKEHVIPLTDSMIEIIKRAEGNASEFVFPSPQTVFRQMSENTLNVALVRLGYKGKMTSHGFRHSASTILHEHIHEHGIPSDVIEMQLAHVEKNSVKGVYNKALYMKERVRLMQWWSDYLDEVKGGLK